MFHYPINWNHIISLLIHITYFGISTQGRKQIVCDLKRTKTASFACTLFFQKKCSKSLTRFRRQHLLQMMFLNLHFPTEIISFWQNQKAIHNLLVASLFDLYKFYENKRNRLKFFLKFVFINFEKYLSNKICAI